jgi:tetratricopeptide (TPR) repeat protein
MKRPAPAKGSAGRTAELLAAAVRQHRAGNLDRAEALYERILRAEPQHADALHLQGLVAHQRGRQARGEALIRRALAVSDRPAAFHNSLGAVLLAQQRPAEAEAALARAIGRDPLYAEAFNNRGNARQALGRPAEAIADYRRALELRPDYAEAHVNLGRALQTLGRTADAAAEFRLAAAVRPDYAKAHRLLGDALGELGRRDEAEAACREAIRCDTEDADNHAALAALLERSSRLEEALAAAAAALARAPSHVRAQVVAARCERRLGRAEAGLSRLDAIDDALLDGEARAHVAFEKAAILDRLGDYGRAYRCYAAGNAAAMAGPLAGGVDREFYPLLIERLRARFTPEWLAGWSPPAPGSAPPPAFLIGFPRSGTTLLDQVLDSHPALTTMEERDAIDVVRRRIDRLPGGYPEALATLGAEQQQELRELYRDEAARHLGGMPAGLLIDKMPLNTIDVGLIHRLFPRAKLILALRHPCDVVLSGFMQAFKPNAAMIHFGSLADTARFYAQVMTLWQHYASVLPLDVAVVRYEDLVGDLAAETRRILAFLGVPWDDAVLGYAERARKRAIATPSYHQVVQPIYRRSVGRWQHYRDAFALVLPILEPFIAAFGYDTAAADSAATSADG